ncbi:type II toxin-antitoxin system RelE/ParE family toxin [Bacillota bacterium]
MTKYRVEIAEPAEKDLRDIVGYIYAQLDAPVTALKMMDIIESAVRNLEDMPEKYPAVKDERLAAMGYRKLLVRNYIVFFTIDKSNKVVDVERILYVRRDWLGIL